MKNFNEDIARKYFWDKIQIPNIEGLTQASNEIRNKKIFKKQIGTYDRGSDSYKIYMVNGDEVKTKMFPDFVEGGNFEVYRTFVPKNEIWVDAHADPKDYKYILLHELIETFYMKHRKLDYNKAHNIANHHEMFFRNNARKNVGTFEQYRHSLKH